MTRAKGVDKGVAANQIRDIVHSKLLISENYGKEKKELLITLSCGHKVMRKYSDAKGLTKMRCPECKMNPPTFQSQESGPYRNRYSLNPLDPNLRRRLSPGSLGRLGLSGSEPDE